MDTLQTRAVEVLASAVNGPTSLQQVSWLLTQWAAILGNPSADERDLSQLGSVVYAAAIIRIAKSAYGDAWAGKKELRSARATLLQGVVPAEKRSLAAKSLKKRSVKDPVKAHVMRLSRS